MRPKIPFDLKKLKKIDKSYLLIGALAGILLLVIALPVEDKKTNSKEVKTETEDTGDYYTQKLRNHYQEALEEQLAGVLRVMDGVGEVEVMITLKDEGESVVEKDVTSTRESNAEEDGQGVKRESQTVNSQEETVYIQSGSSESTPFIAKEVNPQVEGVLVVAKGGGNATVVKNISDAVLALFPVEPHKIKVVKMN